MMQQNKRSTTDRYRLLGWSLFTITVLVSVIGWFSFDLDPGDLAPVLTAVTAAAGIGEAANVGKRATAKVEVMEWEEREREEEEQEQRNPYVER